MAMIEEYYILYADVLGYKNEIEKDEEGFLSSIRSLMQKAREKDWENLIIFTFSDNILVFIKGDEDKNLKFLCHYAARLQELIFRDKNLLLRGGITKGNLYYSKENYFVYGTGLVNAVILEEKMAVYPRIILDSKLSESNYIQNSQYTIMTDSDSAKFINYLNYYHKGINNVDKCRKSNFQKFLSNHNKKVDELKNNTDTLSKGLWLKSYFEKIEPTIHKEWLE